jgi:mannose-6-phosphate isomerase-like protein (cupin superfamily)
VANPRQAVLADLEPAVAPVPVDPTDPAPRLVGHYHEAALPEPGPLQMKGFRSATARNVGLWMLVDEVIGAVHHTLFMVQFAPTGQTVTLGGQHYHPFEEIYYIVEGDAIAHLEDESIPVGVGDVVFAGVNSLHGFSNKTDARVRWIEAQSPAPPSAGAFFFPHRWAEPG